MTLGELISEIERQTGTSITDPTILKHVVFVQAGAIGRSINSVVSDPFTGTLALEVVE
jgi:hypothetical protein